jgi:hypothetical protein
MQTTHIPPLLWRRDQQTKGADALMSAQNAVRRRSAIGRQAADSPQAIYYDVS